jgi:hypothetical protein
MGACSVIAAAAARKRVARCDAPGHPAAMVDAVRLIRCCGGTLRYEVALPPEGLPSVSGRDLLAAWDAAREAAAAEAWGEARAVAFRRKDGALTELMIADEDARCWASAVDGTVGLESLYGMALCFRLLALIEVMAEAPWTRGLFAVSAEGTEIHPALLGAAARFPLAADARFDHAALRASIAAALPFAQSA